MYAYCLNRPIIFGDFTGEDAVLLLDKSKQSHIGIMAQDESGTWWHFYWGPKTTGYGILSGILWCDVPRYTWYKKYTGEITLDAINASGQYDDYEDMLYFSGDFSLSAKTMKEPQGSYNLLSNNCAQVSLRLLAIADTDYSEVFHVASQGWFPSAMFYYVKYNPYIALRRALDTLRQMLGLLHNKK